MNNLILDRLKEIKQLQNIIKLNELDHKAKSKKDYNFSKILLPNVLLRNIHRGVFINKR